MLSLICKVGDRMEGIIRLQKNAESTTNKIRLPKDVVKRMGNQFYMEIHQDKIILIPIKKGD